MFGEDNEVKSPLFKQKWVPILELHQKYRKTHFISSRYQEMKEAQEFTKSKQKEATRLQA
jgi:hypothetical protein